MHDRTALLNALSDNARRMLQLVDSLTPEQRQVPVLPGINPPVWELGHCAWFFERFIFQMLDGLPSQNPGLDAIWDSFELLHEERWQPGLFPDYPETATYFTTVMERIAQRIAHVPLTDGDCYLYRYAIHHMQMHMESLVWCRQTLGYPAPDGQRIALPPDRHPSHLTERPHGPDLSADSNTEISSAFDDAIIESGLYALGIPADSSRFADDDFGFDNEKPGYLSRVSAFRISRTLTTNRDFLAFVTAEGYQQPSFWSRSGARWRSQTGLTHPLYWQRTADGWMERIFDQWIPLQPDWPVRHISLHEAQAWCRFANRRLPTEIEWEIAALHRKDTTDTRRFPWGPVMENTRVDMDCTHLAAQSVHALPEGQTQSGCLQMMGTLWEWTASAFMPYDGFRVDMYPLMSVLQFGTHQVVRGGSFASASELIRGTYRQAYLPERNDVFVGFRTCALSTGNP